MEEEDRVASGCYNKLDSWGPILPGSLLLVMWTHGWGTRLSIAILQGERFYKVRLGILGIQRGLRLSGAWLKGTGGQYSQSLGTSEWLLLHEESLM